MNKKELMLEAYKEAEKAYNKGECPVGAVIARNGAIIARSGNRELELNDPTAHAEILVLREAGQLLSQHNFPDCTVYSTLWPCPMCENALLRAKVPKIVCGARSFKYIFESQFNPSRLLKLGPVMEKECKDIFVRWLKETGRDFILEAEE